MLFWSLDGLVGHESATITIVYRRELDRYNLETICGMEFPGAHFRFVRLAGETNDACETTLAALEGIDDSDSPVAVVDPDAYYLRPVLPDFSANPGHAVVYQRTHDAGSEFSYVRPDSRGNIRDIAEKKRISDYYCTGFYGFRSVKELKRGIEAVKREHHATGGEVYLSSVYKHLISRGENVRGIETEGHISLGTPIQLRCAEIDEKENLRFCFDLDNTLVTYRRRPDDYASVEPCRDVIQFARFLKSRGHRIIIATARRMLTHGHNAGAVVADIAKTTIETLERFGIPYDELHFGKPYAHFYIDDAAVRPGEDLEKMTGMYDKSVSPRVFNRVICRDGRFFKESKHLSGERHFYENIPDGIRDLFPVFFGSETLSDTTIRIEMERVRGIPLAHLNASGDLRKEHLEGVLSDLERIHGSKEIPQGRSVNIYANYAEKIEEKRRRFDYERFQNVQRHISGIVAGLRGYESEHRGVPAVIHGDPVFTNILLMPDGGRRYIDMRGSLGDELTIFGDRYYDYAKVYQSLLGYDPILLGRERIINTELLGTFEDEILSRFGIKRLGELLLIVKSFIASLLPNHPEDIEACLRFDTELFPACLERERRYGIGERETDV